MEQMEVEASGAGPVAVCSTAAAADLIAATLAAHGIRAGSHAYFHAYPSVDWVEGYRVTVADADEAAARRVLEALSRPDVVTLPP